MILGSLLLDAAHCGVLFDAAHCGVLFDAAHCGVRVLQIFLKSSPALSLKAQKKASRLLTQKSIRDYITTAEEKLRQF